MTAIPNEVAQRLAVADEAENPSQPLRQHKVVGSDIGFRLQRMKAALLQQAKDNLRKHIKKMTQRTVQPRSRGPRQH